MWKVLARISEAGTKILSLFMMLLVSAVLLYSLLGLRSAYVLYKNAALGKTIEQYNPLKDEEEFNPSIKELQKLNPDTVGWLTIAGTNINYPVVQGEDNYEYINKDIEGNYTLSGSIFLDSLNDRDFADPYSLLYGHHMDAKLMFGELSDFLEKDYFSQHKKGYLFLPDKTYEIELFAALTCDAFNEEIYAVTSDRSIEQRKSYIRDISSQYRQVEGETGKLIGLSTCYGINTNERIVVFGQLRECTKQDALRVLNK